MWDVISLRSFGGIFGRKFGVFVALVMATVFGYTLLASTPTHAADATWASDTEIVYNGTTYTGPEPAANNSNLDISRNLQYFISEPQGNQIGLITFQAGVNPLGASRADYARYNISSSPYERVGQVTSITLEVRDQEATSPESLSSCRIEFGVGWVVCPISRFFAAGMDNLFSILTGYLNVPAVSTNTDGPLYGAWSLMRNIANIAFVISFLIIVYAQLTNNGISNYGIKKLLPRIVIAAILVNVSFYITAVAVDLSNVVGVSLQSIFEGMRGTLVDENGNHWDDLHSWTSIVGFILAGGSGLLIAGGAVASLPVATAGSLAAATFLLLPILMSVIFSVLVALALLAARQALITVLIVISPLAFVAFLLPNTQQWFTRWRSLFTTMLLVFPIFSILFGGSQLAAALIIQNSNELNVILLALFVQVAPLVITPFLIRFSGQLLSRLAGFINSPKAGFVNRTSGWAKKRADYHAQKASGQPMKAFDWKRPSTYSSPGRRLARGVRNREEAMEERKKAYQTMAQGHYRESHHGIEAAELMHQAENYKNTRENQVKAIIQRDINVVGSAANLSQIKLDASQASLESAQKDTVKMQENNRTQAGLAQYTPGTQAYADVKSTVQSYENIAIQGIAAQSAQNVRNKELAQALSGELYVGQDATNTTLVEATKARGDMLRTIAGGIDPQGARRAEANALKTLEEQDTNAINATIGLLNHRAIRRGTTLKSVSRGIFDKAVNGQLQDTDVDDQMVEAAVYQVFKEGDVNRLRESTGSFHIDRQMLVKAIAQNSGTLAEKGAWDVQNNPTALFRAVDESEKDWRKRVDLSNVGVALSNSSASDFKSFKASGIEDLATRVITMDDTSGVFAEAEINASFKANLQLVYDNVYQAVNNPDLMVELGGDKAPHITTMFNVMTSKGFDASANVKQNAQNNNDGKDPNPVTAEAISRDGVRPQPAPGLAPTDPEDIL